MNDRTTVFITLIITISIMFFIAFLYGAFSDNIMPGAEPIYFIMIPVSGAIFTDIIINIIHWIEEMEGDENALA